MQQHVLTIGSAPMPCLHDFFEDCPAVSRRPLAISGTGLGFERRALERILQFITSSTGDRREIVHEVDRVFDLVGDAAGELTGEAELSRSAPGVPARFSQFRKRLDQFGGALLDLLFETDGRPVLVPPEADQARLHCHGTPRRARHVGDLIAAPVGMTMSTATTDNSAHSGRQPLSDGQQRCGRHTTIRSELS